MQLLSRREYNLILRSLDKYELYMNQKEKELSEKLQINYIITYIILKTELLKLTWIYPPYMTLKQRKIRAKIM